MKDYIVYQSDYIANNQNVIFEHIIHAHAMFKQVFPNDDSTWSYHKYNIFSLTAPSSAFYTIYTELRNIIREQLGDDQQLWLQSWINYHNQDQLLNWHAHEFPYHGYISIDPKDTKTVFENYEILNKPGQIYFGPGYRHHMVEAITPFQGVRTTIGFDVLFNPTTAVDRPYTNMSLIPLL